MAELNPPIDIPRPRTRDECRETARPCGFVACRHHLALDVVPVSSLRRSANTLVLLGRRAVLPGDRVLKAGALEHFVELLVELLDEMEETCSLDVASEGEHELDEVGGILRVTTRQIRRDAIAAIVKLRALERVRDLRR